MAKSLTNLLDELFLAGVAEVLRFGNGSAADEAVVVDHKKRRFSFSICDLRESDGKVSFIYPKSSQAVV